MKKGIQYRIAIVGTGNLAFNLIHAFKNSSVNVVQVLSRSLEKAQALARLCDSNAINSARDLFNDLDLVIFAVKDDVLDEIFLKLFSSKLPVVHCSGSVDISVLEKFQFRGVLYPLQTFSKDKITEFIRIPFFIEANNSRHLDTIQRIAFAISSKVELANSEERKKLHIAAVFACNFTNSMYQIAEEICEKNGMKFDYLHPLILETAQKAVLQSPKITQTGPAARADIKIIKKHLTTLKFDESIRRIYSSISNRIMIVQEKLNQKIQTK